ncbi:MAG: Na+/H+ antiporter NhaA [Propionibacteriaceae bacterium]
MLLPPQTEDHRHLADILRSETTGGLILLVATAVAMLWANVAPHSYSQLVNTHLGPLSIGHWISDGLLVIFFFVAGLELKREFVEGSLSRPAQALVPIAAAVCGMVIPALLYVAINLAPGGKPAGWAIPMATDIAFALAVLAIVGSQLPTKVRAFLLTLAIVDDLGSIIVIAAVFTTSINLMMLLAAIAVVVLWWGLQRAKIDFWPIYVVLLGAAWWCMHASGVHATIAGVACGLATRCIDGDDEDPVNCWQHAIEPWSAGLVVPLFALATSGVQLRPAILRDLATSPVSLGIIVGLVLGKLIGVGIGSLLVARLTHTDLAPARRRDYLATAQVAGIGFTVSLLLAELTFAGSPVLVDQAKLAVVVASVVSAVIGGFALRRQSKSHAGSISGEAIS